MAAGRSSLTAGHSGLSATIFLCIILLALPDAWGIDWDQDIIPSPEEEAAAKNDALSKYFGAQVSNLTLFRSYQIMERIVGKFKDVPEKE